MNINKIEHIKNITIYSPLIERFDIDGEGDKYLELQIKFFSFKNADLNYLEKFSKEIIGKTIEEFIQWLIIRSKEEGTNVQFGSNVFYFLDNNFPNNYNEKKYFQYYNESAEETISNEDGLELGMDMGYYETDPQPQKLVDKLFKSEQEAIDSMFSEYPFFKVYEEDRADGF
jgi:hypothetical protein